MPTTIRSSVTRFVEFSPSGKHFKSLGQLYESSLRYYVESYLDIFNAIGRIFIVSNGRILKNNIEIWSH